MKVAVKASLTALPQSAHTVSFGAIALKVCAVMALGMFVLAAAWWSDAPYMANDSHAYVAFAADMADGHVSKLHLRSPGYPLLLLLTGSTAQPSSALFFTCLAMHAATILILAWMLKQISVPNGMIAVLVVVLALPPNLAPATLVLSEVPAEFALVVGCAVLLKWFSRHSQWTAAGSGAAFAIAALIRPTYQILALVTAFTVIAVNLLLRGALMDWRRVSRGMAVHLATFVLLVGGYSVWSGLRFGYFGLSPLMGFNLTTRTVKFVERIPDEHAALREELVAARDASIAGRNGSHTGYQYIWDPGLLERLHEVTGLDDLGLARYMQKVQVDLIARSPLSYLSEAAHGFTNYWLPWVPSESIGGRSFPAQLPDRGRSAPEKSKVLQLLWTLLHFVFIGTFALQAIVTSGTGLDATVRRWFGNVQWASPDPAKTVMYWFVMVLIFYTALISSFIDVGDPRQRWPTDSLILFATLLGFSEWWRRVRAA